MYPKQITDALSRVKYPGTGKNLVEMGMVEDGIRIDGTSVRVVIVFGREKDPFARSVMKAAEQAIKTYVEDAEEVNIVAEYPQPAPEKENPLKGVKHVIGVASGKGGVGKSTIAVNLAIGLARLGRKVGLLDADIHGPSIPTMLGMNDARPVMGEHGIVPEEKYGLKVLSIGFFMGENALVWRGGLVSNAVKQLVGEAEWGDLDYLVIDMPPGTGDIHLTLIDAVNFAGVVIVSTPQKVALDDARKGIDMFMNEKLGPVKIIGIVENMAWFTPKELPGNKYFIFGEGGAKRLAEELNVNLLAQIPIEQAVREDADKGEPAALGTGIAAERFIALAQAVEQAL